MRSRERGERREGEEKDQREAMVPAGDQMGLDFTYLDITGIAAGGKHWASIINSSRHC